MNNQKDLALLEAGLFETHFILVANVVGVPMELWDCFREKLFEARNDGYACQRVAEKYFALFDFQWPEGLAALQADGKRGTHKQLCRMFFYRIYRPVMGEVYKQRALLSDPALFPYIQLRRGPALNDCPIHKDHFDKLLTRNDPIFDTEFHIHPDCMCFLLNISKYQLDKMGEK